MAIFVRNSILFGIYVDKVLKHQVMLCGGKFDSTKLLWRRGDACKWLFKNALGVCSIKANDHKKNSAANVI